MAIESDLSTPTKESIRTPKGQLQLTVTVAAGFTADQIPLGARRADIQADPVAAAAVRWRDDGTAPTTAVGMYLTPGDTMSYWGDLTAIQFVAVSGSPKLNISFYN